MSDDIIEALERLIANIPTTDTHARVEEDTKIIAHAIPSSTSDIKLDHASSSVEESTPKPKRVRKPKQYPDFWFGNEDKSQNEVPWRLQCPVINGLDVDRFLSNPHSSLMFTPYTNYVPLFLTDSVHYGSFLRENDNSISYKLRACLYNNYRGNTTYSDFIKKEDLTKFKNSIEDNKSLEFIIYTAYRFFQNSGGNIDDSFKAMRKDIIDLLNNVLFYDKPIIINSGTYINGITHLISDIASKLTLSGNNITEISGISMRTWRGFVSYLSLINFTNLSIPFILCVPRENYAYVRANILTKSKLDLSKCVLFVDRDLEKPGYINTSIKGLYTKNVKPLVESLGIYTAYVPQEFIKENVCVMSKDLMSKPANIFEIPKIKEEMIKTFLAKYK